jgi:[acyl-carrier-protein] S-malonyltransferase
MANIAARAVELPVSAPFHCRLMRHAAEEMKTHLSKIQFKLPQVPVISSVTGRPITSAEEISHLLENQITDTVQWYPAIEYLRNACQLRDWIAVGPTSVLANLLRKDFPQDRIRLVIKASDIHSPIMEPSGPV